MHRKEHPSYFLYDLLGDLIFLGLQYFTLFSHQDYLDLKWLDLTRQWSCPAKSESLGFHSTVDET
jgi:hypothetical protein